MKRAYFFILLVLFALTSGVVSAQTKKPNIVIVYADDLGYADIGVFGAKGYRTPNLDRLAKEGVRFTDFHVAQAVCSASRAALLTGCYPNRIGIAGALNHQSKVGIGTNEMTLAELVKQKGYATAMIGKWHLGIQPQFHPTRHGFDYYFGLPYSNDMWPHRPDLRNNTYPTLSLYENEQVIDNDITAEDQPHLTKMYTEKAVGFIEQNHKQPFLLYVAHSMPHVPIFASEKFKGKSERGLYGDVIEEVDWSVGEILKALRKHKLDRDTLVIFTSDNGPWLTYGDHAGSAGNLREGKGTSWEGGIRVPFIARWAGKIKGNSVCNQVAMTIDLFPTIAKLADASLPNHKIDGRDIWNLLSGKKEEKSAEPIYYHYYASNELQAVRRGNWKLILPHAYNSIKGRPFAREGKASGYNRVTLTQAELYHLETDPGEQTNLALQRPDIVRDLEKIAEEARAELGDSLTKRTGANVREPGRVAGQ